MAVFLGIPVILFSFMLQIGVVSRLTLLHGSADLVMVVLAAWALQEKVKTAWIWSVMAGLLVGVSSGLSLPAYVLIYLVITGFALVLRGRVWQAPILAMFVTVLFGTVVEQVISLVILIFVKNISLPVLQSLNQVSLPSLLLNLFLVLPVYGLIQDLADWVYPMEIEP